MTIRTAPLFFWLIIICAFGYFLNLVSAILLPFVVGMGLAYILDPLADRLEEKGMSRAMATVSISGIFFAVTTVTLIIAVPILLEQTSNLVSELPTYIGLARDAVEPYVNKMTTKLEINKEEQLKNIAVSLGDNVKEIVSGLLLGIMQSGIALANFVSLLVITPVVSFYLLRDWDKIIAEIDHLLPRNHADTIREQCRKIDVTLSSFMRGTLNVMLVLATFYAITLTIAGLKYSLLIAIFSGVMIIIPYIGTTISGLLAVGIAYIQFGTVSGAAIIGAIFVAGQMLEGYVLTPKLVGESVGLNPAWIIFGMLAGGAMMGFVGILIAVPVTAVCGVLLRFGVQQYCQSDFYYGGKEPSAETENIS